MEGIGHYDEDGKHRCPECGAATNYQIMSGGEEFYCPTCGTQGYYPAGDGGPRARLLTQGPEGVAELGRQMVEEMYKRKKEQGIS